jgi:parvulin-like peptidyl-prolyl isomerase
MRFLLPLAFLFACDPLPDEPGVAPPETQTEVAPVPVAEAPAPVEVSTDPAVGDLAVQLPDAPPLPANAPQRIAARHILVSYAGALGAKKTLRRTRAEARTRAESLLKRVNNGEEFAALAKEASDDSSSGRGGDLGTFGRGAMEAHFESAAFGLAVGAVSMVVETPFGFHIIRREALEEVHLAQILVQWAGLPRSNATRSKEEARARAEEARAALLAGEKVDAVAVRMSEGANGPRGGDLGWFQKGQLLPQVDEAAFALKVGETAAVIESAAGFHVIQRLE